MNIYKERVQRLQKRLVKKGIFAFLLLGNDVHCNEYLAPFFNDRAFMSGFSGSAGTLLITQDEAFFFTDGRYFIQAKKELEQTGIVLVQSPDFMSFLREKLPKNAKLALNDKALDLRLEKELCEKLGAKNVKLIYDDFVNKSNEKPFSFVQNEIYEQKKQFSTKSRGEKLALVREKMKEKEADFHLISSLDDIAWLTNLRGSDIEYNPLFFAFLFISKKEAVLFCKNLKPSLAKSLENEGFTLLAYENLESFITQKISAKKNVWLDENKTSLYVKNLFKKCKFIFETNPSTLLKAQKNKSEIRHIQKMMIDDGIALCEAFCFLEKELRKGILSELDIESILQKYRSKSRLYKGDSFATIAGFKAHSALPHYRAKKEDFALLQGEGILLIDSGGHYENGTSDVTRILNVGKPNKEQKKDYTLVLKALIALSKAVFPKNLALNSLDVIARAKLWENGLDFNHGTGHGVGYFLNVHESPVRIAYKAPFSRENVAKDGFISSIEPALYKEGKWGIRLENLVAFVSFNTGKSPANSQNSEFLCFQTLTLCPFERIFIDETLLDESEKIWLNAYHQRVFELLYPHLSARAKKWLEKKTAPL